LDHTIYEPEYTNSRALIVGINSYHHVSPLDYACNDAEAIFNLLIKQFNFSEQNVTILKDSEATKKGIMDSFFTFTQDDIDPNDRILFFFAGHGETRTGRRGEVGFLVPADGNLDDLSTLIRWDDLTRNSELIKAKHILFIMDACYGGLAITRSPSPGSTRFLKDMLQRFSRQVLTAGKANEVVADAGGPLPNHSVFTGHLLQALEGKAATQDGIITANGVMAYVYEKVAKDQYSQQTPHYGFLDGDGDFIFKAPMLDSLKKEPQIDNDILIEIPQSAEIETSSEDKLNIISLVREYLTNTHSRIKLHDLAVQEVQKFLSASGNKDFPVQTSTVTTAEFINRLKRYESISQNLQNLVVPIAHWGTQDHIAILQKIMARTAELQNTGGGTVVWLNLRWYPTLLLMYAGGVGAIAAENYQNLFAILTSPIGSSYKGGSIPIIIPVAQALLELRRDDMFRQLPDHKNHYVPYSEYLFKLLQPTLDDLLFLGKNYELVFDRFEIFSSLAQIDLNDKNGERAWCHAGRFAWKYRSSHGDSSLFAQILKEAQSQKNNWPPLKAGFFDGSYDRFDEVYTICKEFLHSLNWH